MLIGGVEKAANIRPTIEPVDFGVAEITDLLGFLTIRRQLPAKALRSEQS
jgi:hypothetical protein